jgi:hypothetical protein
MKTDTATIRIKDRGGQQVVQIEQNCAHHNESDRPPVLVPHHLRNNKRDQQMICVVENMSKRVQSKIHFPHQLDVISRLYFFDKNAFDKSEAVCYIMYN